MPQNDWAEPLRAARVPPPRRPPGDARPVRGRGRVRSTLLVPCGACRGNGSTTPACTSGAPGTTPGTTGRPPSPQTLLTPGDAGLQCRSSRQYARAHGRHAGEGTQSGQGVAELGRPDGPHPDREQLRALQPGMAGRGADEHLGPGRRWLRLAEPGSAAGTRRGGTERYGRLSRRGTAFPAQIPDSTVIASCDSAGQRREPAPYATAVRRGGHWFTTSTVSPPG